MLIHVRALASDPPIGSRVVLFLLIGTLGCGNAGGGKVASADAPTEASSDRPDVSADVLADVPADVNAGPDSPDAPAGVDLLVDVPGAGGDGTGSSDASDASVTPSDGGRDASPDAIADGGVDSSVFDGPVDGGAPGDTGDGAADGAPPACGACTGYGPSAESGRIASATLSTVSGIAASRNNPGVLYVHADMQRPEFFAVSEAGVMLGTYTLTGATVQDLEDMAVAPCPSGSCVYLADIGGNLAARANYTILRAPEPSVQVNQAAVTQPVSSERLVFTYPDGAHNAESLLIDPSLAAIYIITKVAAGLPSAVYRVPAVFGAASVAAQKVADLTVPGPSDQPATSASAHPCLPAFLLTTNTALWEFRAPAGGRFEDSFAAVPMVVPVAQENQREGVTYRSDGRGYFTTGEGTRAAINRVTCR